MPQRYSSVVPSRALCPLWPMKTTYQCYVTFCSAGLRQGECSISRHCIIDENDANVSIYQAGSFGLRFTLVLHMKLAQPWGQSLEAAKQGRRQSEVPCLHERRGMGQAERPGRTLPADVHRASQDDEHCQGQLHTRHS